MPPRKNPLPWQQRRQRTKESLQAASMVHARTQAETDSAHAAAELSRVSARKGRIETLRLVIASFAVTYGLLAVFGYTFFVAGFFPGGLTAGDALFFGFVALALGLFGMILSMSGAAVLMPFCNPKRLPTLDDPEATRKRLLARMTLSLPTAIRARRSRVSSTLQVHAFRLWAWWHTRSFARSRLGYTMLTLAPVIVASVFSLEYFLVDDKKSSWANGGSTTTWLSIFLVCFSMNWFGAWGLISRTRIATRTDAIFFACPSAVAMFALIYVGIREHGLYVIMGCVLGGAALAGAISFLDPSKQKAGQQPMAKGTAGRTAFAGTLLAASMVLPTVALMFSPSKQLHERVVRFVFGSLGIRIENAMLSLSIDAADAVRSASMIQGVPVSLCRESASRFAMSDVLVLWHGIGQRTYIEWPSHPSPNPGAPPALRMDLPTSGVSVVRGPQVRCVDVPDSSFFQSGQVELVTGSGQIELVQAVESEISSASSYGLKLVSMEVVGHADPMPRSGGNERLALDRARKVVELLDESESIHRALAAQHLIAKAVSLGARYPVRTCPAEGTAIAQRECNAVNRRVEIRLRFSPVGEKNLP